MTIQRARTIIARNDSPDIPFTQSINPYQGCEHGCIYCYARPTHAYLDLSPGLDFETKLFAKPDAPALLRAELAQAAATSAIRSRLARNTDPYQPIEREWKVTRSILEVLAEHEHPFTIVTKSALVERDLDLIAPMAAKNMARVYLSITTLDRDLARTLEPRAAAPARRLQAMRTLARRRRAGGRAGRARDPAAQRPRPGGDPRGRRGARRDAAPAGSCCACRSRWRRCSARGSTQHYPLRAAHVMSLINALRGGRDYESGFGTRMRGTGHYADLIEKRFALVTRRCGLGEHRTAPFDTSRFRPPRANAAQAELF